MLATLFLQLSPVDLLDDTLTQSTTLLPDAEAESQSGFAQLLRVRVGAVSQPNLEFAGTVSLPQGDSLPEGGNFLPGAEALPLPPAAIPERHGDDLGRGIEASLLPAPQVAALTAKEQLPMVNPVPEDELPVGVALRSEDPDISLQAPVVYPAYPAAIAAGEDTIDVRLPSPLVAAKPGRLTAPVIEVRAAPLDAVARPETQSVSRLAAEITRPEIAARTQQRLTDPGILTDAAIASDDVRERGRRNLPAARVFVGPGESSQLSPPETRAVPVVTASQTANATRELAATDVPEYSDPLKPQRSDHVRETVVEVIRPRSVMPAAPQATQTPIGVQPTEAVLVSTLTATSAAEVRYPQVITQTTDLISTPVRDASWGDQIGERVLVMAGKNLQSAEIRLTPAELGPVRVRVSIDDGAANVTFHAQHAVTREALEQAMPRLREMLAENGLSLGQADVTEQGVAERDGDGQAAGGESAVAGEDTDDPGLDDERRAMPMSNRQDTLVDTFA